MWAGAGSPDPCALQVAHPLVQKQLVDYVHNGFLVPVMGPALHKVGASHQWCRGMLPCTRSASSSCSLRRPPSRR